MFKSLQIKKVLQCLNKGVKFAVGGKLRYIISMAFLSLLAYFLRTELYGFGFLALAIILVAVLVFCFYLLSFTNAVWAKIVGKVMYAGIALAVTMVCIAEIPIITVAQKKEKADSDYCIVLGCAVYGTVPSKVLSSRVNSAYEFLTENPECKAILSGGMGEGEGISEARCMYNMLTARGIAQERLIKEERSTSTKENLYYSKELIEKESLGTNAITVISSETHLYRACLLAKEEGFDPKPYKAHTDGPVVISQYLRESVAVWYEWLF